MNTSIKARGVKKQAKLFASVIAISAMTFAAQANAQASDISIEAQQMESALNQLAQAYDKQIVVYSEDAKNLQAKKIDGAYTEEQALDEILNGTGLTYKFVNDRTIAVGTPERIAASYQQEEARSFRMVRLDQEDDRDVNTIRDRRNKDREGPQERDTIIVTGTNIRGIAPESSPTRTFDREDIEITGASTAQDFIQTLTTNFGGGSNQGGIGLPNDINSTFNASFNGGSFGSSVNLRGLGSGATLVLLNGRRIAPSSGIGEFTDISMIPASALERVDVLSDGASSIYGGDAVAGVVNFITRRDFEGVEASLRYGGVTEGNLDEFRASITGGTNWSTGNVLVSYEFYDRDNLSAGDRKFSQDAVLPNDLLPQQERHSVLTSISQEVAQDIELFVDATYLVRDVRQDRVQTDGDVRVYFSASESLSISGGALWDVSNTWSIDLSAGYSKYDNDASRINGPAGLLPVIGDREVNSVIWTVDARASGTLFEMPGGSLKVALGGHYRGEDFSNFRVQADTLERDANRDVYALFGEVFIPVIGSGNSVPLIERLEINVSGRYDDYSDFGSTLNPKVGVLWSPASGLRLRSSFSTSFNPPPLGRVGASDFVAASALTSRWNGIFGLTPADPSIADATVITAFGTSAELDAETSKAFTGGIDFEHQSERQSITISTTYFDIDFEDRLGSTPCPACNVSAIFDAPNVAFDNPEFFPDGTVIFNPSNDEISNILSNLDFLNVFDGTDPTNADILNLVAVVRNLAKTKVRGVDFNIAYDFDFGRDKILLGLDGTYLIDFQQQAASTTPAVQQLNTLFNPVDLRLRARAGYASGGLSANLFLNYVDGYKVDNTDDAAPVDSWTTVDFTVSYDTGASPALSVFRNLKLQVSAQNLFNEQPPATPSEPAFGLFGFDPTNASPLGRFISFEATKRF